MMISQPINGVNILRHFIAILIYLQDYFILKPPNLVKTEPVVYIACVISSLLYSSET